MGQSVCDYCQETMEQELRENANRACNPSSWRNLCVIGDKHIQPTRHGKTMTKSSQKQDGKMV